MTDSVFQKNVECLRKRYPALANRLQCFDPEPARYDWQTSSNGMPSLCLAKEPKQMLFSDKDPLAQARSKLLMNAFEDRHIVIFYGFGLGYMMQAFCERRSQRNDLILVIEPDLEFFHKAIQITDFNELFSCSDYHFWIGEPLEALYAKLFALFSPIENVAKLTSRVIIEAEPIPETSRNYFAQCKNLLSQVEQMCFQAWGSSEDTFHGMQNSLSNLTLIHRCPGIIPLENAFANVPAFIVSAGPSLNTALPHMYQLEEKGIVIAVDATLKPCLEKEITPHFVVTLERDTVSKPYFDEAPETKDTCLAWFPLVPSTVFEHFYGPKVVAYRGDGYFHAIPLRKGRIECGASSSHFAFKLAVHMGCNPIVLIGQDLAFHPTTFQSHADRVAGNRGAPSTLHRRQKENKAFFLPGNTSEKVLTEDGWFRFMRDFEFLIAESGRAVINTSEFGLKIEGAPFRPLPDVLNEFCKNRIDYASRLKRVIHTPSSDEVQQDAVMTRKNLEQSIAFIEDLRKRQPEILTTLDSIKTVASKDLQTGAIILQHLNSIRTQLIETPIFKWLVLGVIASDHIRIANRWNCLEPLNLKNFSDYVVLMQEWFGLVGRWLPRIGETLKDGLVQLEEIPRPAQTASASTESA